MPFFDMKAKKAFLEIISRGLCTVTQDTKPFNSIHLTTDPGGVQNQRPGVYVIQNVENGMCMIGQTLNLRRHFSQYTTRSAKSLSFDRPLNANFYNAAQEGFRRGLQYSQSTLCCVHVG